MDINWSISADRINTKNLEVGKVYEFNRTECPVFAYDVPITITDEMGLIIGEGIIINEDNTNQSLGSIKIISVKKSK
ncbi:hypothetical protein KC660_00885 [Candidatus Dojkabacteria bacterium]|uniref:Uncharacterized protein n=1 Tax=Candidatus Dojkabacteria bacterium TaxID=2099670 RepID=A0A955RI28_9BACT|nr:hypothetical protein [Candidatus Dojkabacteria bacterium]